MQFLKNAIFLNLKDLGGGDLPIGLILLFFFVGLIAATVITHLKSAMTYRMIEALVRHKAFDEDSAKTLRALGLSEDQAILRAVKNESSMLKRFVSFVKEDKNAENTASETEKAPSECKCKRAYYLGPANADRAKQILSEAEPTLPRAIGYCLLLAAFYLAIALLAPIVLPMLM
jgi:hypothetical protein